MPFRFFQKISSRNNHCVILMAITHLLVFATTNAHASIAEIGERNAGASASSKFRDCPVKCPEMVLIPPGEFMMGGAENQPHQDWEAPQHHVSISYRLAVGKFDVTFQEWDACVADGGCNGYHPSDNGWGRGKRPVINVNWEDAQAYVTWLSKLTGKRYQLLSEAEWEYAARAGTTTRYYTGDTVNIDYPIPENKNQFDANSNFGRLYTTPVGTYHANPFGLYDMIGNVFQWTQDCNGLSIYAGFHDYKDAPINGSAYDLPSCGMRVVRGSSWSTLPAPSYRRSILPQSIRHSGIGFRVARRLFPDD